MNLLAIDTSQATTVVAIGTDGELVASECFSSKENLCRRLIGVIESILHKAELSLDDIDRFGVVVGPGSFTGLRIGLSTIKSLAWSQNKTIAPIHGMDDLAKQFFLANPQEKNKTLTCAQPSRKGWAYIACYKWSNDQLIPVGGLEEHDIQTLTKPDTSEDKALIGLGAEEILRTVSPETNRSNDRLSFDQITPESLIQFAYEYDGPAMEAASLSPLYVVKSVAEQNLSK